MVRVIVQGLGPIGRECARYIAQDSNVEFIGAIDINPDFVGTKVEGVTVSSDETGVYSRFSPGDVLLLTTQSEISRIESTIMDAVKCGLHVVSPSEELFYASNVDSVIAGKLDVAAKRNNVSIVGGGVNPGCLMDAYPVSLFREYFDSLEQMYIYRHDDTMNRRLPLLKKTGAGLTPVEFMAQSSLGHVGLELSASYVSNRCGLSGYDLTFIRKPVVARKGVVPANGSEILKGQSLGLHEICSVSVDQIPRVYLDLQMYVGATCRNGVDIRGVKDGKLLLKSFDYGDLVNGDIATVRILHDAISKVGSLEPGLNRGGYVPDIGILKR